MILGPGTERGPSGAGRRRRARFTGGTSRVSDVAAALRLLPARSRRSDADRVEALHAALRGWLGVPHVFSYGAGRMALHEALRGLGVGPGDEVIIPGFTCAVVANAVLFLGAVPVYADIELERLGPDPREVHRLIGPRTRAIVAHHLFGVPCRIDEILEAARERGVPVIEDAAMGLGGRYRGRPLGTLAAAGFFSFERTKVISSTGGGVLATAESSLAQRVARSYAGLPFLDDRRMRLSVERWLLDWLTGSPSWGRYAGRLLDRLRRARRLRGDTWEFACEVFDRDLYEGEYRGRRPEGYPWRLHGALAELARRQVRRLDRQVAHRNELAAELARILERKGADVVRIDPDTMRPAWARFPFWVDDVEAWARRLRRAGVECHRYSRWFEGPVHPASCMDDPWFGYERGACPRGEWLGGRILNLPVTPRIGRWLLRRIERM